MLEQMLKAEKERLEQEITVLKSRLAIAKQIEQWLRSKNERLEQEKAVLKRQLADAEREVRELKEEAGY